MGQTEGGFDICQNGRRSLYGHFAQLARPNGFKTPIHLVRKLFCVAQATACSGCIVLAKWAMSPNCSTTHLSAANSIAAVCNLAPSIMESPKPRRSEHHGSNLRCS